MTLKLVFTISEQAITHADLKQSYFIPRQRVTLTAASKIEGFSNEKYTDEPSDEVIAYIFEGGNSTIGAMHQGPTGKQQRKTMFTDTLYYDKKKPEAWLIIYPGIDQTMYSLKLQIESITEDSIAILRRQ